MSILCIQNRLFGMKEIIGNLVVTDLQEYVEKSSLPLTTHDQSISEAVNDFSKTIPYNFNHIRKSVIDAYEGSFPLKTNFHRDFFFLFQKL